MKGFFHGVLETFARPPSPPNAVDELRMYQLFGIRATWLVQCLWRAVSVPYRSCGMTTAEYIRPLVRLARYSRGVTGTADTRIYFL